MTAEADSGRNTLPLDEERLAEQLDQELAALHRGALAGSGMLPPEAASLMNCLQALERLAAFGGPAAPSGSSGMHGGPTLPRSFGRYELLAELGRGGMGVVYRARQSDLGRQVAVKMILSAELASADAVRRFYEEARAASRLRHAGIVGILEVGELDGQHYFAMDLIEGQSLADRLRSGPLEPESAARLLADVARAVDYLHSQGLVHRDLKPANILLDAVGRPYVSDFGLAKLPRGETPATRAGTIIGTPNYMPPEQAAGHVDEIDERSDVYSLGAILYETLTGRPPFREASPLDTLVQVLEGEPTLPRQLERRIPRELEWICLRAIEKNPADRYPTAAALADDLERHLRQDAIEARPSRWWHRLRRWSRREPALAMRLGGLALAAAVVQIIWIAGGENLRYHLTNLGVLTAWAASAVAFRWLLGRSGVNSWAPYAWLTADVVLLTTLLCLAPGPLGPLLAGYPLLIAASGLFSQVRLVWFTTALALGAYLSLEGLRADPGPQPHYRYFFVAVLAILGFVVAFQVRRVRALARYYETRRAA